MTYILGWKFGHSAYVVADTALTLMEPTKDETEQATADRVTSFGELTFSETERVVGEGVLKQCRASLPAIGLRSRPTGANRRVVHKSRDKVDARLHRANRGTEPASFKGPPIHDREARPRS